MANKKKLIFLLAIFFLVIWSHTVSAQMTNRGDYYGGFKNITNYAPDTYGFLPQNLGLIQNRRGLIYVANQGGIMEYDGVSWRIILIPKRAVLSIAEAQDGTIYVGGNNEIGRLEQDKQGNKIYVSMVPQIEESIRDFSYVYQVLPTKDGVWFRASKHLFLWQANGFKVWQAKDRNASYKTIFQWNGRFFAQQQTKGLMEYKNGTLRRVNGSEILGTKGQKLFLTAKYDENRLLMGTRNSGLILFDGTTFKEFTTEMAAYLKKHSLYHGIGLSNGDFALATLTGGLVIMDGTGHLKGKYTTLTGLQDDYVKFLMQDQEGSIWLALNQGISRIDYHSPISFFDHRNNLKGLILSIVSHENSLYVGTSSGLFALSEASHGESRVFQQVRGTPGNCWDLLSLKGHLLTATRKGVFGVNVNNKPLLTGSPAYVLHPSTRFPDHVWVATDEGLTVLQYKNNGWLQPSQVQNNRAFQLPSIRFIQEEKDGTLWLGTASGGVVKMTFPKGLGNPGIQRYGTKAGLPARGIRVIKAAGHIMFASPKGIFRYNKKSNRFESDMTLGNDFAGGGWDVFRLAEAVNGDIYFHSSRRNFLARKQKDNGFIIDNKPFLGLRRAQANAFLWLGKDTWIGDSNGLIRFDTSVEQTYDRPFNTMIRSITLRDEREVLGIEQLTYEERHLHVRVAAGVFQYGDRVRYQFKMAGYEKDWSPWRPNPSKDYPNMPHGDYMLKVRSINLYDRIGKEDTFHFRILPPWYLTWWAFILYAAAGVLLVVLIVRWRSAKLMDEKLRLEKVVAMRTRQINQANIELKDKALLLEEQSQELTELNKVKSRFFANISHEFRTPLTLILGPLDRIRSQLEHSPGFKAAETGEEIDLVRRNAQRLLGLINQLMDLSRFESGKMKFRAQEADVVPFIKSLMEPFTAMARQHELELSYHSEISSVPLYFDREKMEKAMVNLLSNGLKFTPPGGSVRVSVSFSDKEGHPIPDLPGSGGFVDIEVRDTGRGIPEEQLTHIFDRFYQADATIEHHGKGSGIGLSLVKEVVTLHHGELKVSSETGASSGTVFTITLPLGKDHLSAEEVARSSFVVQAEPNVSMDTAVAGLGELSQQVGEKENKSRIEPDELFKSATETNTKSIILVVEDNADLRRYIAKSLTDKYKVVEAENGKEGLERARAIIPDLIISDIMMPEIDGIELCQTLKKDIATSHIPVVLLTARASEEAQVKGLEGGADDYITKPFNPRLLEIRIHNLIQLRQQLQLKLNRQMVLQPTGIEISEMDREFLKDLQEVIEKNMSEPDFNVEDLSKRLYMSRTSVYRKIQALSGDSPTDFIRSYRLMRAAQLLKIQFGSVTEVAFEVGFNSRAYFTKCFKEKFHQLPSEYITSQSS
jgi:signal transduction histidine kinase/DNA-binding response OmpR family regulator/ligand-binding sensor domain-containing protein